MITKKMDTLDRGRFKNLMQIKLMEIDPDHIPKKGDINNAYHFYIGFFSAFNDLINYPLDTTAHDYILTETLSWYRNVNGL